MDFARDRAKIWRMPAQKRTAPVATLGRYELLRCLASGGMGEVFLARQSGLHGFQKQLVIKVLLPAVVKDAEFLRMFLDEARIAGQLNHANIAQVFDLGSAAGQYYIAMEYVRGASLQKVARAAMVASQPMPHALAARVIADAAAGLHHAHTASDAEGRPLQIVHRDVSPQNILVAFDGTVKVIDFGIAKATERAASTQIGVVKGKAAYMSPEQAIGHAVDCRSDVFSLAVVLYELLAGRAPFRGDNEFEVRRAVHQCQVVPPSKHALIDAALESIVLRALRKEVGERFPDASSLRLALEGWIAHQRQPAATCHVGAWLDRLFSSDPAAPATSPAEPEAVKSELFPAVPATLVHTVPELAPPRRSLRLALGTAGGFLAVALFAAGLYWAALPVAPDAPFRLGAPQLLVDARALGTARVLVAQGELERAKERVQRLDPTSRWHSSARELQELIDFESHQLAQAVELSTKGDCAGAAEIAHLLEGFNPALCKKLPRCTEATPPPKPKADTFNPPEPKALGYKASEFY